MVIVVMSDNTRPAGDLAQRLADALGWPLVDTTGSVTAARDAIARAHDRREHIVISSSLLSRTDRQRAVALIRQVRVVQAVDPSSGGLGWREDDALLAVDVATDPDSAVAAIRDAFGL